MSHGSRNSDADATATTARSSIASAGADHNISHLLNKDGDPGLAGANDQILVRHDLNKSNHNSSYNSTRSAGTSAGGAIATTGGVSEITEEYEHIDNNNNLSRGSPLTPASGTTSLFSIDINNNIHKNRSSTEIISSLDQSHQHIDNQHVVYVAVGKSETSKDSLSWTLNHDAIPGVTLVYLVHIFPELKFIPSPLGGGRVPRSQVSAELAKRYLDQDRTKRRELLQNYTDMCTAHRVQAETILIESDSVTNALVELISVLDIPKLVIGITKSDLRKLKGGKGNSGILADQILQSVPMNCEVKIICQGNDVSLSHQLKLGVGGDDQCPTPSTAKSKSPKAPTHSASSTAATTSSSVNTSFSCCFKV